MWLISPQSGGIIALVEFVVNFSFLCVFNPVVTASFKNFAVIHDILKLFNLVFSAKFNKTYNMFNFQHHIV